MGLLDDAIREHLDLKRRHGADPREVDRLEREALGPVRRGPEETDLFESGAEEDSDYYEDDAPKGSHEYRSTPRWDEALDETGPLPSEYDDEPTVDEASRSDAGGTAARPAGFSDPTRLRFPPPHPARRAADSSGKPSGDETVELDVEPALAAEAEEKDDDVLEETPEFLQDAPDHDRLWFEHRPPRDFDFDG